MYFSEQGDVDDDPTFITTFAVCGLRSAVSGLRSAVCGLQSAVCGLQSANIIHRHNSVFSPIQQARYIDVSISEFQKHAFESFQLS